MSEQRTLSLGFREFQPNDYERLVAILNANYPDYPISVAERRSRDGSLDRTKYLLKRFECIDQEQDRIVGFGELMNLPDMYHPRKFMVNILVDTEQQRRGIGRAIYNRLDEELTRLDAILAWSMIKEDLPQRIEFFRKRGFSEKTRIWESRLDLTIVDPGKFAGYIDKALKEGITFTTLAEEQPYEQWETFSLNNPQLLPEGYIIARDGPRYVGMSNVHRIDTEPGVLHQDDTGVIREYRGRGIATALKLRVIEYGKKNGYRMIKTWNDSDNWPMLAVNTKLGFKRQVGWITMEKILRSEASA